MAIEDFIKNKALQKAETEAVTVRLASSTVVALDEFSSTLGATRQEVIAEFVVDALRRAQELYEKNQNQPDLVQFSETATSGAQRYFLLNTNKSNSHSDHTNIVSNGLAAAFYDGWKQKIDMLKKGDVVFLYESGVGIVGFGKASGDTQIRDRGQDKNETHQQQLEEYRRVAPLSAREIKKLTGSNLCYLQTMVSVSAEQGAVIEEALRER